MRKFIFAFLLCASASSLIAPRASQPPGAVSQTVVTAAQINGTWRSKYGEFKVLALGKQRLKVAFSGTYEYKTPSGPMANVGEGSGIATIEGDTATFKPEGAEDECKITMRFTRGKLIVTQQSNCGFGNNVSADGTYRKVSAHKPKFDEGGCN
jgi:hypothetical protein